MGSRRRSKDAIDGTIADPGAATATAVTTAKRGFLRRLRVPLIAFFSLVAVLVAAALIFALILNNSLGNVKKIPLTISDAARPATTEGDALNILLLGADAGTARNGAGTSILKDAAASNWPTGKYRSDATMLVHITSDRKKAYVISIPRDSYVKVYDSTGTAREDTKINAALSLYGPSGAVSTVENFTNLRMNHLAMVDWDGFESITNSLGGVDLTIPGKGTANYDGSAALAYVRERHHLPHGDFDRVKRQQNFLRAIMSKLADKGTLTNPIKLTKTVNSVTKNLAVDDDWSTAGMRSLALSLRKMRPADITFMTIPTNGTASDPTAGSIVVVDKTKGNELFVALRSDAMAGFLDANPSLILGGPHAVS